MLRNKLIVCMLIVVLFVVGCDTTPKEVPPSVSVVLSLEKQSITSGDSTKLYVQLSGDAVDGTLDVKAIRGAEFVNIQTNEDNHIKLADKASVRKLVYQITGNANVTAEPIIQADLNWGGSTPIKSNQITLRVTYKP